MMKKTGNVYDKAVESKPKMKVPAVNPRTLAPGERFVMIVAKGNPPWKIHKWGKRKLEHGVWLKADASLLRFLLGHQATHTILALPPGVDPEQVQVRR